jgi:hypothetical protein
LARSRAPAGEAPERQSPSPAISVRNRKHPATARFVFLDARLDDRPWNEVCGRAPRDAARGWRRDLVDVRRFPGSRRNPQFSQAALAAELEHAGIAYVHAADLGGRRSSVPGEDRFECLRVSAFRSYAAWMSSNEWQQAIADALVRENPCFMCAETLPWRCHRRLIADLLSAREIEVVHLIGPGTSVEQRPFAEAEIRNGRLYLCGALVA